jgi:hypothetical protein
MRLPDSFVAFRYHRAAATFALALIAFAASGCSSVKPWQRGVLADRVMRADRDPAGLALTEHVYFSREAASGGRGVGGGGCGCN